MWMDSVLDVDWGLWLWRVLVLHSRSIDEVCMAGWRPLRRNAVPGAFHSLPFFGRPTLSYRMVDVLFLPFPFEKTPRPSRLVSLARSLIDQANLLGRDRLSATLP